MENLNEAAMPLILEGIIELKDFGVPAYPVQEKLAYARDHLNEIFGQNSLADFIR